MASWRCGRRRARRPDWIRLWILGPGLILLAAASASACHPDDPVGPCVEQVAEDLSCDDDDPGDPGDPGEPGDPGDPGDPDPPLPRPLFASYVALGSGLTAGYRSRGISPESQIEAYPVLLARAMGTPFDVPLLADPGCPAPILDAWTLERPPGGDVCAGRAFPTPDTVRNVAVPGTFIADLERTGAELAAANPLHAMLLGERTQLEAALAANPTFVTVEFGMDDAVAGYRLDAPVCCTDIAALWTDVVPKLVKKLVDHGVQGGVIIGPGLPYYAYFAAGETLNTRFAEGDLPPTFQVSNCDNTSQNGHFSHIPFDYLRDLFQRSLLGESVRLDCLADPPVITFLENFYTGNNMWRLFELGRYWFDQYGWIWTPQWATWPNTGLPNLPGSADETFGPNYGLDGVYPTAEGHRIIASNIIKLINAKYGTSLAEQ